METQPSRLPDGWEEKAAAPEAMSSKGEAGTLCREPMHLTVVPPCHSWLCAPGQACTSLSLCSLMCGMVVTLITITWHCQQHIYEIKRDDDAENHRHARAQLISPWPGFLLLCFRVN